MAERHEADIVIVGGGLAGIIAGYELLNEGKKVLIVDRDTEANFGGLAKWAFGGMFFVDSPHMRRAGIKDSIDLATKDWYSFAEFEEKEVWGKKWADQYLHLSTPHGYRWLREEGIQFFPVLNWTERGLHRPGNSVPRFHMVWGTGWELTYNFVRRLKNHPRAATHLKLLFDHRVRDIIVENSSVVGVSGQLESSDIEFEARGGVTIIATGGINGSIEKVKRYWNRDWCEPPETILNGAHEYAIGDLHEATEAINGNVVNLDKQWNYVAGIRHYAPRKKDHGLSLIPMKSALWLNYQGRRFGPMPLVTPYDTRYLVERICQEPIKYSWQLLNTKIAYKEFAISGSEHNAAIRDKQFAKFVYGTLFGSKKAQVDMIAEKCEDVVIGRSVEELVEKMNALTGEQHVKNKYIEEAIAGYDGQIDRGEKYHNDEQLRRIAHVRQYRGDRVRTCKFQKIYDKDALPLIAIREFILSRKSMGGIQTDLQSRVLSTPNNQGEQTYIDGLYAIGEAAGFGGGGMHGHRSLEGTFLGGCVINARVAAASIMNKTLE